VRTLTLPTGAEARVRNEDAPRVAVLVNGGSANRVPGTWSATSEWLAQRLSPRFPAIAFVEVRYRTKSWHELPACVADAEAALDAADRRALLVGFSMGGAVAIGAARHDRAGPVLGLAPWIPPELDLAPLANRRFDVVQGAWDRWLPGIPGVSATHSREGFERALAAGATGTYTLIPRGLHGVAVRARRGGLVTLPGAGRWLEPVSRALTAFAGEGEELFASASSERPDEGDDDDRDDRVEPHQR
jgi:pimeloyl-ACP methyl ester carboxylesterase